MQKLLDLLKAAAPASELEKWNFCREYLQLVVLRSVFNTPTGASLAFQGGTCLRICHQLRRYSEDLDFSLLKKNARYSMRDLHASALKDLARLGYDVSGNFSEDKVVQKAFIRIGGLPERVGLTLPPNQKLSIKLEVDVRPPARGVVETHFVARMNELFPVLKYDLPTLFAGKALAILLRPYERGRDYYDLIWFLSQRVAGNLAYFQNGLAQSKKQNITCRSWQEVLAKIEKKVTALDTGSLTKDLRPFLEDPSDLRWLKDFPAVFKKLLPEQPPS